MRRRIGWLALALVFLVGGFSWAAGRGEEREELFRRIELLAEAMTVIRSDYVEPVGPKELVYGALKGMIGALDRHSQFLDPEAFREMQVETRGEFGGLGMEITLSDEEVLTIVSPMEGTPSAQANLKPGDRIVKIDGNSTRGIALHEAVKQLRGKPGSTVVLTILRESEKQVFDVQLKRSVIRIPSIKAVQMLPGKIGYARIVEFQDNTPRDLLKALKQLRKESPEGWILDLRNNPGGLLDVAVEVAQAFLPEGKLIVYTKGRVPDQNMEFSSRARDPILGEPIVVLVNGGSASASEIVAGALRDHGRAVLLGEKTFGKGSVQTVIPLSDGSAVRLTTSLYYTPSGQSIHGQGLEPDLEIHPEPPPEGGRESAFNSEEEAPVASDPMVIRAIRVLKEGLPKQDAEKAAG
ncbi:MAG: peptidase S41 [Candidatus Omnitrophica bacterium CG11_big_fil_rev_8_21_14_0_20_64_10]|nr:MAG: peptidase S41 [Candidatus Omnitrophica bacterium CG11_big_fil_rev_8_21_14_0_20_64_10]